MSSATCGWCNGSGQRIVRRTTSRGDDTEGMVACSHPGPVVIRALPGAEWRVTKYEASSTADSRLSGRHAMPTWKAPAGGAYAAFKRACHNPVPMPGDEESGRPAAPAPRRGRPAPKAPAEFVAALQTLLGECDAYNALLSETRGYRVQPSPGMIAARKVLAGRGA